MSEQIIIVDFDKFEELCIKLDEIEAFLDKEASEENIMALIQTFFNTESELIKIEIVHVLGILSSCIINPILKTMINCFLDANYIEIESSQ